MDDFRHGVRLTPLKARIFDLVARAGARGIDADEINRIAFDGHSNRDNIKTHVAQINDLLVETDYRIEGTRGGDHPNQQRARGGGKWSWGEPRARYSDDHSWPYRLIKRNVRAVA